MKLSKTICFERQFYFLINFFSTINNIQEICFCTYHYQIKFFKCLHKTMAIKYLSLQFQRTCHYIIFPFVLQDVARFPELTIAVYLIHFWFTRTIEISF